MVSLFRLLLIACAIAAGERRNSLPYAEEIPSKCALLVYYAGCGTVVGRKLVSLLSYPLCCKECTTKLDFDRSIRARVVHRYPVGLGYRRAVLSPDFSGGSRSKQRVHVS